MEGNGAANGPMFEPQDVDTRVLDAVTGEPTEPRTYLLSAYTRGHHRGRPRGAVIAERIIQVSAIPRWPESSPGGTAYVIPIGGLPKEDAERPWDVLQYGNHLCDGGEYESRSDILGDAEVIIRKSACSGITYCRHLAPELLQPAIYTNLDAYWGALERVRIRTTQNFATQGRQEAISWAWSIKKDYDEKKACKKAPHGQGDTCIPGVHSNEAPQGSRANSWVACALASAGGRSRRGDNHQKEWIPSKFDPFLSEIRQIITSTQPLPCIDNNCHVVDKIGRKAKTCEFGHDLSGPGEMVKVEDCPARITSIRPRGENPAPWIIINSKGVHNHPPPPESKVPPSAKKSANQALSKNAGNGQQKTELRQFQHSVHYDDWLDSNGAATADEVTPHFVNHGYFGHLIRRSNAIDRPYGSSREGVEHEWRTLHQGPNRYIQSVISTGDDFMAICFTQSQAELWGQIGTFQVDMNFKKVHRKLAREEHEVIFGARVGLETQFLVLARAYMSSQTAVAYEALFRELFRCLNACRVVVQWKHIHGEGLYGVTMDQDAAAIKGLGKYLHSIRQNIGWKEHVRHCARYCHIHFRRGVASQCKRLRVVGAEKKEMKDEMNSLLDAVTQERFDAICESLLQRRDGALKGWIDHKKKSYISCGLSQAYTLMPPLVWNALSTDTNGVESLHQQSYTAGGRYTPLLSAIRSGFKVDVIQMTRHMRAVKCGMNIRYKERTPYGRYRRANQRKRTKQASGDRTSRAEATSSGVVRTRGARRPHDALPSETLPDLQRRFGELGEGLIEQIERGSDVQSLVASLTTLLGRVTSMLHQRSLQ